MCDCNDRQSALRRCQQLFIRCHNKSHSEFHNGSQHEDSQKLGAQESSDCLERSRIKFSQSRNCYSFNFKPSWDSITTSPLEQDSLSWLEYIPLPLVKRFPSSSPSTTRFLGYQWLCADLPNATAPGTSLDLVNLAHYGEKVKMDHVSPRDYALESWNDYDIKDRDARTKCNKSFDGLFCLLDSSHVLWHPQHSPSLTSQGITARSKQLKASPKFYQYANGPLREMENKSDHLRRITQPQFSPFHENPQGAVAQQKHAPRSLAVKVLPGLLPTTTSQRPLHKSPADSHLFLRYAVKVRPGPLSRATSQRPLHKSPVDSHLFLRYAMGQPSWREKYEIHDLLIPHCDHEQPDPFGTPLSKSAIKTFQTILERVCVPHLNAVILHYLPDQGFCKEIKKNGTTRSGFLK